MTKLRMLLFIFLVGCADKGTVVNPKIITVSKDPLPKEPEPIPKPDPIPEPAPLIKDFFEKANGQWLGTCISNSENQTSVLPGFKIDQREYIWINYRYQKTADCHGSADPHDGGPVYWLIESVKPLEDGWFLLHGNCNSVWSCQDKDQFVMIKFDGTLTTKVVQTATSTEGSSVLYSTGPSR